MSRSVRIFAASMFATAVTVVALASPAAADDPVNVPAPTTAVVGGSYQPAVTGGQDGTAATLSTVGGNCSLGGDSVTITFVHAGSCEVDAEKGTGETGSVTFTIDKADQTITFDQPAGGALGTSENLVATGGDSGEPVTFTSVTPGVCTVTGDSVTYDHAGLCTIAADQAGNDDYNAAPEVSKDVNTDKTDQTITFTQPDGGAVNDSKTLVATSNSGLPVSFSSLTSATCTVTGDSVTYDHAGMCTIAADQDGKDANGADTDYNPAPQVTRDVTVTPADQTITVSSVVPTEFGLHGAYVVNLPSADISASSGLPVQATVDGATTDNGLGLACSLTFTSSSFRITADHAGTCVIDLDQDGTDRVQTGGTPPTATTDYNPAPQQQLTITVDKGNQSIDIAAVTGSARTVGSTYVLPTTTKQGLDVDLGTFSGACSVDTATHTLTLVHTGNCSLNATGPGTTGNADYNGVANRLPSFTVEKGASTVTTTITRTAITATITQAHGSGADLSPGDVTFQVDGHQVGDPVEANDNGVVTLTYTVPAGATRSVTATYSGSNDLLGSSDGYTRSDPTIRVAVRSSVAKTKYGWYRKPVTATFTCTAGSAAVTSCSKPVTLSANGKRRALTGKAATADGGAGSTTTYVNIDATAPTVKVTGPANGAVYVGTAPKAKCVGTDALSGISTCALRVVPRANGVFSFAATAVDKAGNSKHISGSYRVMNRYLRGVTFDGGTNSYLVQSGQQVTLVALAPSRPTYLLPVRSGLTPHVVGHTFYHDGRQANSPRWSLTVTLPSLRGHEFWSVGVKVGATVYKVKIRVTG